MKLSVAILAQVGIQAPGLSFRCICHLGNPIKTRFESGFCLLCTSHGTSCLSPYHQVWEIWLYWILSALCGGRWVQSGEEAGYVQNLWEDFPAPERHSVRLLPSKVIRRRETAVEMSHLPCLDGQVWFPGVTHRAIKRYQKVRMQSWRTARSLISLISTGRSEQMTNCVKFSRTCQMNTNRSSTVTVSRRNAVVG